VTIENINWHLEQGKEVETAIMDGAAQIVTPAFVSLLCICIVFVPMFFLTGVPRFLFVPMAEAVMAAMVCSFILSRTLVPTMANYLLQKHAHGGHAERPPTRNPLIRFQRAFEHRFERLRLGYRSLLMLALANRAVFVIGFLAFVAGSFALTPWLGRDFFPSVDAGQILMHARLRVGTRVEESANQFAEITKAIRQIIPPDEIAAIVDNIGMPVSGINMTYNNTGTIGTADGDVQIKLREGHRPTADYVRIMREELPARFPGVTFSFVPADIISQILNFGTPAPIDLQIRGPRLQENFAFAQELLRRLRHVPGLADARIQQSINGPGFNVEVDRTRAQYAGVTARDVTNSMVVNLAGLEPGLADRTSSIRRTASAYFDRDADAAVPDGFAQRAEEPADLGAGWDAADARRDRRASIARHAARSSRSTTSRPWCRSTRPPRGRDLGAVAADVQKVVDEMDPRPAARLAGLSARAGAHDERSRFAGLLFGLLAAIVLIYLLIVVNFQSWSDPVRHRQRAAGGARRESCGRCLPPAPRCRCRRSPARSCAWASRPRTAC
jgi:multidrug efflux pump subunit AcrB